MTKVFINGSHGTTGLRIRERLLARADVELLDIDYEQRRDEALITELTAASDVTFLCLPDDAAKEAVAAAGEVRVIDTSTAHRTLPEFAYGFPELSAEHRAALPSSKRVAVPGCHASGFLALVYPLVKAKVIPVDYPLFCHSLTGYSGGGKAMIAEYEDANRAEEYSRPRQYAFTQSHKHVPEMTAVPGLKHAPIFVPVVEDFYAGMLVTVPLHTRLLPWSPGMPRIWEILRDHYAEYGGKSAVSLAPLGFDGYMDAGAFSGRDDMEIYVTGNDERILLSARFDNLGKGASGAALQCFNIMVGADESSGLVIGEESK